MSASEVCPREDQPARADRARLPTRVDLSDWRVPVAEDRVSARPTLELGRVVVGARAQRRVGSILTSAWTAAIASALFAGYAVGASPSVVFITFLVGALAGGCVATYFVEDDRRDPHVRPTCEGVDTYHVRGPWGELIEEPTLCVAVAMAALWLLQAPTPWHGDVIGILTTLAVCAAWGRLAVRVAALTGRGTMRVAYPESALAPGRVGRVRLGLSDNAAPLECLRVRAAAYVERPRNGPYAAADAHLQVDARWALEDERELPSPGSDVELRLALPPGPPTQTTVGHRVHWELGPRVYWELEVYAQSTAGRFVRRFPLPVYAEDASSGASVSSEEPGGDA